MSNVGTLRRLVSRPEYMEQFVTVVITNAQLKVLRATPKTLVAAPGSTRLLQFTGGVLILKAGANVLAETADNLAIKYTDGSGVAVSQTIECTGFIDQSVDTITNILPKVDAIVAKTAGLGKALVLHNTGDGEWTANAAADATLVVRLAYRVWDFS